MHSRAQAVLLMLTGGTLLLSLGAWGQDQSKGRKVLRKPSVTEPVIPARRPVAGQDQPPVIKRVDELVGGKRLPDSAATPRLLAQIADCSPRLSVEAGQMLAGTKATIRFADAANTRGAPVAVINGEPVYAPNPRASNERLIMPRIQNVSLTYTRVATSAEDGTMLNGWFAVPGNQVSAGQILKDFRDGTAEVMLPPATDAIFRQEATLTVVTDRCTLTTPITIRPAMHSGRWFPPTLIVQCMRRRGQPFAFDGNKIDSRFRVESDVKSRRPIEGLFQPSALSQNCGPYGALHEGGNDEGAGSGSGTDIYVFWDGGFDPAFTVTPVTEPRFTDCIAGITHIRHPDGGGYIGKALSGGDAVSYAGRSVLEVKISWKITKPWGFCWYALVAKGRHPTSLRV